MDILLTGVVCCPGKGSEPGAGWNWLVSLAKIHRVSMITSINYKEKIDAWKQDNPEINFNMYYIGSTSFFEKCKDKPFGYNVYYMYWLKLLRKKISELIKEGKHFDLIQHLTFSTFKFYVPACEFNIPFVLGPAGGGERTPKALEQCLGKKISKEKLREMQLRWSIRSSKIQKMLKRCKLIVATTEETSALLPKKFQNKIRVMQAIGIQEDEILSNRETAFTEGELKLIYAGRIEMWKGIIPLIDAVKLVREKGIFNCIVNVYGDGADLPEFKHLVKEKGVENCFNFTGRIPRSELMDRMIHNDVFMYTSYRDSGSMAVIEAMCQRIPVVCFDVGGQRDFITSKIGYKVDVNDDYDAIVRRLADTIIQVYTDYKNQHINNVIEGATDMLKSTFIWYNKAQQMTEFYKELLK